MACFKLQRISNFLEQLEESLIIS